MFIRADQLWLEEREGGFPLHALEFHWHGFEPGLTCRDLASGDIVEFDLHDVRFLVSRKKTCVGYFGDDGHVPCPKQAPVTTFGQCPECSGESFIPIQECIFEPRCDGEKCDHDFCRREHVLYLAFYDTHTKIGMSSSRRVERRLVEQGADAFAVIGSYPTRRKAREAEKDISSKLRIPQSFRQEFLLRNFSRPVDSGGIESRYEGLRTSLGETYQLEVAELRWLDRYPIELPLKAAPQLQETPGRHRGEFVGVKGKWLIYENEGVKALSLADLPSRFLSRE
jgi:hypothetical protein